MNNIFNDNSKLHFLKHPDKQPENKAKIKSEKKFGIEDNDFIICKNCGNPVTTPESIISVNEKHQHIFTNPTGIVYQIGCFSSAEGCNISGDPTAENTWFAGFNWSYAACSNCMIHLGWFYERDEETFFGLIIDLLEAASNNYL
jgi:hypothetical protein